MPVLPVMLQVTPIAIIVNNIIPIYNITCWTESNSFDVGLRACHVFQLLPLLALLYEGSFI